MQKYSAGKLQGLMVESADWRKCSRAECFKTGIQVLTHGTTRQAQVVP
jgi:hypothetical protein